MNLDDLVVQIKLTSFVCTFVAILTTVIRLSVRRWQFWFDDACALLSSLCITAQMGLIITIRTPYFTAYYLIFCTFYSTVWFARLSILVTIIRIESKKRRRYLHAVMVLFLSLFGLLIGQLFWVCEPQRRQGNIICTPTMQIAVLKMVSDAIADVSLLVASFKLFLAIQDKPLRCRLSFLFSTCVITTAISLVNSSFILSSKGLKVIIIALVEGCISIIVCNLPILSNLCSRFSEHTPRSPVRVPSSIYFAQQMDAESSVATFVEPTPIPVRTSIMMVRTLTSATDNTTMKFKNDIPIPTQHPMTIPHTSLRV